MANNKDKKEVIKDLDKVEPIDYGVVAKPHTPIYKMHRYFARRPYTVFRELIKHYSNPGSIILDPMCGGGVTIVEGLRLRRKVIGVDLNPMAIFITRCEVMDVDLDKLKKAFYEISEKVKDEINSFYHTICPKCKKETPADWFEWSNVVECPYCKKEVILAEAKKIKAGTYQCLHCKSPLKALNCKRKQDKIVRLKIRCACGFKGEKKPDEYDFEKYKWIEDNFDRIVKQRNLWYPKDKVEDLLAGWKPEKNRLVKRGINYFSDLFTKRNLLALSILKKDINFYWKNDNFIGDLLYILFASVIDYSTKISRVVQGAGREITVHAYWPPEMPCENNVFLSLTKRWAALLKGKIECKKDIGIYFREASSFKEINKDDMNCLLLSKSATNLKEIPNSSIDVIITDPPYGSNVNYLHLSMLWLIWLRDILKLKFEIDSITNDEAIVN
ncbi:MAG: DNA methyltransferase, partial [candidate division WOR-3 bacterium]